SRSRSPRGHARSKHKQRRSRSPRRGEHSRHKRRRSRSRSRSRSWPVNLPFGAQSLPKDDFAEYEPLFSTYLRMQKNLHIEDLDDREIRGRWKSFVGKWNRGDLEEGWYDPKTQETAKAVLRPGRSSRLSQDRPSEPGNYVPPPRNEPTAAGNAESDSDDFTPALPRDISMRRGPAIPGLDDLKLRNELREEDRALQIDDIRYERKKERNTEKERLEELVPRGDPGSRERQLEKKQEVTSKLQDFRDAKEAGEVEVPEADLMGDDGIEGYKKQKQAYERKKTEREIQKEERIRAKEAEREARLAGHKAKEASTMEYFKQLAKARFG
ncbi:hypothetical protein GQ43DRAFT_338712, partial [Delitschia confertaspora ATCC 74209]